MIRFTKHAHEKFALLRRHGVSLTRQQVLQTVQKAVFVDYSRVPLLIAQSNLDERHVLRVVYRKEGNDIVIITFYPGRKLQYD